MFSAQSSDQPGCLRKQRVAAALASVVLLASACGSKPAVKSTSSTTRTLPLPTSSLSSTPESTTSTSVPVVSATAIPLGDGHVSTSPRVGYVDSCTTNFAGKGAQSTDPWVDSANNTWNSKTKITVQGSDMWPNASHTFTLTGSSRVLATNDLPSGEPTGNFPISASDPASAYDRNPNHILPQTIDASVPADPEIAPTPTCLGLGPIGVSTDGVLFFDALDADGRDAGAHEVQDSCAGHPQSQGMYHYHTYSSCLDTTSSNEPGSSILVGYAADGFGIFLERDSAGNLPTNSQLDSCHGRTSQITWDGQKKMMYHYDITSEYPYTLGCFRGIPTKLTTPPMGSTSSRPPSGTIKNISPRI